MCKYDTGDLPIVRKSDIHKMCIGFSRKARIKQQVFTNNNCSAPLYTYQFLFSPADSLEIWFASHHLVISSAEGARAVGTMLMGKEERTI